MWYSCGGCNSAFELGKSHRMVNVESLFCPLCGAAKPKFVDNTDEQWWLTMMAEHEMPRELLQQLLDMFNEQRRENRFDLWLAAFEGSE